MDKQVIYETVISIDIPFLDDSVTTRLSNSWNTFTEEIPDYLKNQIDKAKAFGCTVKHLRITKTVEEIER